MGVRSFYWHLIYFTFGFNSSCERALLMFSLVIRFTPVSTVAGTLSPLDAAIVYLLRLLGETHP
jgi:hypothetical protein